MRDVNLALIIKLYREGRVTDYVLCSEIEEAVQSSVRVKVEISKKSNSQLPALLPVKTESMYKLRYIIPQAVFDNSNFTPDDIAEMILTLHYNDQDILMELRNRLKEIEYNDLSLGQLIAIYMRIYQKSCKCISPRLIQKVNENKLVDLSEIDEMIVDIEEFKHPIHQNIEQILTKGLMPAEYIDECKALVDYQLKTRYVFGTDSIPSINVMQKRIEEVTGDTSDLYEKKEIPHDYKPSTSY